MDLNRHCRRLSSRGSRGASRTEGRARLRKVQSRMDCGPGRAVGDGSDEPMKTPRQPARARRLRRTPDADAPARVTPQCITHELTYLSHLYLHVIYILNYFMGCYWLVAWLRVTHHTHRKRKSWGSRLFHNWHLSTPTA